MKREATTGGWAKPSNSRKFHYFGDDRRSLCGKWMFFGEIEADDGENGLLDCAACDRKLRGRQALNQENKSDGN